MITDDWAASNIALRRRAAEINAQKKRENQAAEQRRQFRDEAAKRAPCPWGAAADAFRL